MNPNHSKPFLTQNEEAQQPVATSNSRIQYPADKGHVVQVDPTGGLFCQKCGKQTTYVKHIRFKILNAPCKFADTPKEQWLRDPDALRCARAGRTVH